jgi:hypothetical protein
VFLKSQLNIFVSFLPAFLLLISTIISVPIIAQVFQKVMYKHGLGFLNKLPFIRGKMIPSIDGKRRWHRFVDDSQRHNAVFYLMEKTFNLINSPDHHAARKNLLLNFRGSLESKKYVEAFGVFEIFLKDYKIATEIIRKEELKHDCYEQYKNQLDELLQHKKIEEVEQLPEECEMVINSGNNNMRNIL